MKEEELQVIVRNATKDDIPEITRMVKEFEKEHYKLVSSKIPELEPVLRLSKDYYKKELGWITKCLRARKARVLVAEMDGKVVGYGVFSIKKQPPICALSEYGHISQLYVKPRFRGRGISSALFEAAREWFQKKGVKWMDIGVHFGNDRALDIYRHWGFIPRHITLWRKVKGD